MSGLSYAVMIKLNKYGLPESVEVIQMNYWEWSGARNGEYSNPILDEYFNTHEEAQEAAYHLCWELDKMEYSEARAELKRRCYRHESLGTYPDEVES